MYNNTFRNLAEVSIETYKSVKTRKDTIIINNNVYKYNKKLSKQLFAYYESENVVIFSIHGAANIVENITAIKKYFNENTSTETVESVCYQFHNILPNIKKQVIIVGHSLGCLLSTECMIKTNKIYRSVFFAPYIPFKNTITRKLMRNDNFIKLIFQTDTLANTGLSIKGKKKVLVFNNNNLVFRTKTNNGHSIKVFKNNISNMLIT